jgi:hypothetical protein
LNKTTRNPQQKTICLSGCVAVFMLLQCWIMCLLILATIRHLCNLCYWLSLSATWDCRSSSALATPSCLYCGVPLLCPSYNFGLVDYASLQPCIMIRLQYHYLGIAAFINSTTFPYLHHNLLLWYFLAPQLYLAAFTCHNKFYIADFPTSVGLCDLTKSYLIVSSDHAMKL